MSIALDHISAGAREFGAKDVAKTPRIGKASALRELPGDERAETNTRWTARIKELDKRPP